MNLFAMTQPLRDRRWFGYSFGLVAILVCLAVRFALGDAALKFPFVIFIPAVVLTTFLGGLLPGIAAALLTGVIADLTLIAPPGKIWPAWPDGWVAMAFYTLTVSVDIALIQGMISAFERAEAAEQNLRLLNEDLERRVVQRSAALETEYTARQKAEDLLRQAQKMEAVGQLTGGVAHDFNNLLTVVLGGLETIGRQIPSLEGSVAAARITRSKDMALEGVQRAIALTTRLLAFSRQQPLNPVSIDANKLVAGVCELLRRTLGEGISLETVQAGGLWTMSTDANQLENALLNLALNARDAMPNGGKMTIETANCYLDEGYIRSLPEPIARGQYVLIAVSDNGTGMDPTTLKKAFEPFFTTKEVGKGTGLGLSQVHGFVRQSAGHVKIYSELGEGTAVKLYLPRSMDAAPVPPSMYAGAEVGPATGKETILVVEDDEALRTYTKDILCELGYRVLEAPAATEALEILESDNKIDLLFSDVVMPGNINGAQLAQEAIRRRPELKVLFMTGYTRNAIVHHGRLDPGVHLVGKPFSFDELAAKVRMRLDTKE
jgi:signal transduction histidine kinase/ActR/RegA family two-component response regulator